MVLTPHLRTVRERRGMPIATLAERANVGRGAVYRAEAGGNVLLDTAIRFAQVLEVPLAEIAPDAADRIEAIS